MDNELKDTGTRNWVKTCLALRCFKEAILPFMKEKSDEQYKKDIRFINSFLGLKDYKCKLCKVGDLKPYHSGPCKYVKVKSCICNWQNTKDCPENGSCGLLCDRIIDMHVKNDPNWSNTNSELWSDATHGPWERMKCFIHASGYKKKTDISEADITAFVHICKNNEPLKTAFGETALSCLDKVRVIRNTMCHSGSMTVAGSEFLTYIKDIENALKLTIFDGFPSVKDNLEKLHILENEKACVTVEDEIEAREEILKAIKDIKCLIQMQQEGLAETDATIDSIRHQLANLASTEVAHIEHIQLRFQDIETHMNKLQDEHMKENEQLQKHKAILESISDAVTIQAKGINRIQKTLDEEIKPRLKKNEGNSEVLGRVEKKLDFIILITGHSPECALDSKVIVNTNTAGNQEAVSNLLVNSANEITRDGPLTKLKNGIIKAFEEIQNGGGQITQVKHECMAIYMRFPTLQSWLEFHRRYLNGEIDGYFQPIQQHLRTYLGYDDLELTVDIYEEDFTANVQSIMYELEATTEVNDETYFAKQTSDTGFNAAPMPPQRDHRTSVSISKSEGQAMSEEMAAMELTIKQLRERLKEREDRIEAIIEARTKEKERDLQKLFAEKERQLQETQITVSSKFGETEQPVAALTNKKTIEQLQEELREEIKAIAEARTKEKERDLQILFAEKERQLQETQITVSRKFGETEQPVAALTNNDSQCERSGITATELICGRILAIENVLQVYPAYRFENVDDSVFVVIVEMESDELIQCINNMGIKYVVKTYPCLVMEKTVQQSRARYTKTLQG